jgi:uncharacterized protein (TIGR02611 family)
VIKRFRERAKTTPAGELAWRIGVAVFGGTITALGAVFLITPGPGWLVVFAGLGILASEFAWAERALIKTKMIALKAARKALPPGKKSLLFLLIVLVLIGIVIALFAIRRNFA